MKRMRTTQGWMLLALLLSMGLNGSSPAQSPPANAPSSRAERIVYFPGKEPLGKYKLLDLAIFDNYWMHQTELEHGEYQDSGEPDAAMGDVRVPHGKGLILWMDNLVPGSHRGRDWYPYKKNNPPRLSIFSSFKPDDIHALVLNGYKLTNHEMAPLGRLTGLKVLELIGTNMIDEDLFYLKPLSSLNYLSLGSTDITDRGLATLQEFKSLTGLAIGGCDQITDRGYSALAGMQHLKSLSVGSGQFSDTAMAHLKNLTGLESLTIGGVIVTDAGLAHLTGLKNLKEFRISMTNTSDAGLAQLAPLNQLRSVWLDRVGNEGVHHLAQLPALESLFIAVPEITPACIPDLKRMRTLKTLKFADDTPVKSYLKTLHEALPGCRIVIGNIVDEGMNYPPPKEWRSIFNASYSLHPGEPLRRIPFKDDRYPFSRMEYTTPLNYARVQFIRQWDPDYPRNVKSSLDLACQALIFYKSKNVWNWKFAYTQYLPSLVQAVGGIEGPQLLGSKETLELYAQSGQIPDWVVDLDTSPTLRLAALEKILRQHAGLNVHFEHQNKVREVILLSGRLSLYDARFPSVELNLSRRARPVIKLGLSDVKSSAPIVYQNVTFSTLHTALKIMTQEPVFNQAAFLKDEHIDLESSIPPDAFDEKVDPAVRRARLKELMDSLARQTGVQYTTESRKMETWTVTRE